ncbi:MAG TPA: thiamine phosphate synthase, partial [Candidatus Binataceae bacterium]|nr:thiamine phosphate synthase [Candidatus Binataceae bacterium]
MSSSRAGALFRLYLITDRKLAAGRGGLVAVVEAALAGAARVAAPGAVAVQLREKDLNARELFDLALALRPVCTRFGAPLLVNDRIDVALAAAVDGVHLPADSLAIADARTLMGSRLIGISTHRFEEVSATAAAQADFAVFGPIYDPLSKPAYGPAAGLGALAEAVRAAGSMPLYALGGIDAVRCAEIARLEKSARPAGIAVIGAVLGAADPSSATSVLLTAAVNALASASGIAN